MKSIIDYTDFEKLELRAGVVVKAEAPEWSRKLIQLTVDFGPEVGTRTILSGIRSWYSPEELVNKRYPFIVNLAERKMGEGTSQGMMLMIDSLDEQGTARPTTIPLSSEITAGTIIR